MFEKVPYPIGKNIESLFAAAKTCIDKKLTLPALVLIHSGIDIAGWLSTNKKYTSRKIFIDWVDAYLPESEKLPCTALDLYGARCGLLHTLTGNSDLNDNDKARRFIYSFGPNINVEPEDNTHFHPPKLITIHIDDLFEEYILGVEKFFKEAVDDPVKLEVLRDKSHSFFETGKVITGT